MAPPPYFVRLLPRVSLPEVPKDALGGTALHEDTRAYPALSEKDAARSGTFPPAPHTSAAPLSVAALPSAAAGGEPLTIEYTCGHTLAQAVYLSGLFQPPALCSGIGLCGRCRMRLIASPPDLPHGAATGAALAPDARSSFPHGDTAWPELPPPAKEDIRRFSPQEILLGWRLGCRHAPVPGMVVELPQSILLWEEVPSSPPDAGAQKKPHQAGLLAVDLGTTSLQWALWAEDAEEDKPRRPSPASPSLPLLAGGAINPQMGAGSEVISRLAVAQTPQGAARMQELIHSALLRLLTQAEAATGSRASRICLAANPSMTALALGKHTATLARAPYSLSCTGGAWEQLPGLPPLWVPPQLSPFVGGDISAGYAALALNPEKEPPAYPFLLADLGTNGEFLLALGPPCAAKQTPGTAHGSTPALAHKTPASGSVLAFTASVALGPALEGIGLTFGTDARPGAVTGFSLTPQGLLPHFFTPEPPLSPHTAQSGESAPPPEGPGGIAGITGTGYLSLLHCLQKAGAMNRAGHFTPEGSPLLRRFFSGAAAPCACSHCVSLQSGNTAAAPPQRPGTSPHPPPSDQPFLPLGHGLYLTSSDVEEVLKVKAAFSLGLLCLLQAAGIRSSDLAHVSIAGSLGEHVDKEALENLGFFPPGMGSRLTAAGNTSLAGAGLLLRRRETRTALTAWAHHVQALDLATDPAFEQAFPHHMRFFW